MVIVGPHPLPMSPGAAATAGVPGTAGVELTFGASSVHRPEKSAAGCAKIAAERRRPTKGVTKSLRFTTPSYIFGGTYGSGVLGGT
jgi:hypothetical protein